MKTIVKLNRNNHGYKNCQGVVIKIELWSDGTIALVEDITLKHGAIKRFNHLELDPCAPVYACIACLVDETRKLYDEKTANNLLCKFATWLQYNGVGTPSQPAYALV